MMQIHPLLMQRQSLRAIDAEAPVSATQLERLLEAARWAPSSGNAQPWRFVAVRESASIEKARNALRPGNQTWANRAPLLIVICANPQDDSIADEKPYYLFDCGLAAENLILQGIADGLVMHPMLGWDEALMKEALAIPADIRIAVVIAIGHPGRLEDLSEELQKRETAPRIRKSLEELVHYDRW